MITDQRIALDRHRGWPAQKATQSCRLRTEVDENEQFLRARKEELETQLIATPAATWPDAAEKARYLLGLLGTTTIGQERPKKC